MVYWPTGFITTFQRGAEWAATGEVTLPIPAEFPNYASWILWEDFQPLSLEQLVEKIKDYELGDSREHLSALSARIRKSDKKSSTIKLYETAMIEILESSADDNVKKQICRELSLWGTKRCIPALEQLKADKGCGTMAEYALERIQG